MNKAGALYMGPGLDLGASEVWHGGSGRLTGLDPGEQCAGSGWVDRFLDGYLKPDD